MSWSQPPGPRDDWRGAYRTAFERIPRPPRAPTVLARKLIFAYTGSKGMLVSLGLVFMAIGSLVATRFCQDVPSDIALSLAGAPVQGTVIRAERARHGWAHRTRITFSYQVGSRSYEGTSSTLREGIIMAATPGAAIPLEVLPSSPDVVRIAGTTRSASGPSGMMSLLSPAVGLGLLLFAIRRNRRDIRAYRYGVPATGLIIKKGEDTTTWVLGGHPFEVVWQFEVDGVTYEGKLSHLQHDLLDQAFPDYGNEVTVLYDPADPSANTVWLE